MNRFLALFAASGVGIAGSAMGSTITVYPVNDGFETPNLSGGYAYFTQAPISTTPAAQLGWTFAGGSGIAASGSGFGVANAANINNNPNGGDTYSNGKSTNDGAGQAAVIQGGDGTVYDPNAVTPDVHAVSLYQSVILPVGTTSAILSFSDEGRHAASGYGSDNGIVVYVDGSLVTSGGTVAAPLFPSPTSNTFGVVTIPLTLGPGSHKIAFAGDNTLGGDATSFVDSVSVVATTPEPASVTLLGCGALGLLARRRRA